MKILLIDDSKDIHNLIRVYLKEYPDLEIISAFSACEGIPLITEDIDLIILDVVMPGMDGITACRDIKNNVMFEDIPIIIITQNQGGEVFEQAFSVGASDFIQKPFKKYELRARVLSLLQLSAERKRRQARELELQEMNIELQQKNEELKKLSMVDGLTGVANRRYLAEFFDKQWKLAIRNETVLSVIMFDLDKFKLYNDLYGHQCGDDVLKVVTKIANNTLKRPQDLLARYGGEEFIIILPETTKDGAYYLAEEIRRNIEAAGILHEDSPASKVVTVSLGVAESRLPNDTQKDLIERADQALYKAKNKGRNQTHLG